MEEVGARRGFASRSRAIQRKLDILILHHIEEALAIHLSTWRIEHCFSGSMFIIYLPEAL